MVTKLSSTVVATPDEEAFKQDRTTTTGLVFGVKGGMYVRTASIFTVLDTTVTLADDSTNAVYLTNTGTIGTFLTGSEPANSLRLFQVVTVTGAITAITDQRVRNMTP